MSEDLKNISLNFSGISLAEMADVSLLKRTDTKFIIPIELLPKILEEIRSHYRILVIKGKRLMNYKSLYFDTPENKFYLDHHNGKIRRTKIRIREYVGSSLFFLEVKIKDGRGNTNKTRLPIANFEEELTSFNKNFIKDVTGFDYALRPSLYNEFQRMTLVNIAAKERITIDTELSYSIGNREKKVSDLAIIELKQERYDRNSLLVQALKEHNIGPYGFSKYCIGLAKLNKDIKQNAFKRKFLKINKITSAYGLTRNTGI